MSTRELTAKIKKWEKQTKRKVVKSKDNKLQQYLNNFKPKFETGNATPNLNKRKSTTNGVLDSSTVSKGRFKKFLDKNLNKVVSNLDELGVPVQVETYCEPKENSLERLEIQTK